MPENPIIAMPEEKHGYFADSDVYPLIQAM